MVSLTDVKREYDPCRSNRAPEALARLLNKLFYAILLHSNVSHGPCSQGWEWVEHIQPEGQGWLLLNNNGFPGLRRALATAVAIEPTIGQNPSAFVQKAL